MANLTYYRPNGEWGIEGVDLSTLPPKVYGALCKLHDLEHKEDMAIEHLAKMCGISAKDLDAFVHGIRLQRHCADGPGPVGYGAGSVCFIGADFAGELPGGGEGGQGGAL